MPKSKHSVAVALLAAVLVAGAFGLWRALWPLWPAFGPAAPVPSPSPVVSGTPGTIVPIPSGPLTAAPGWTASLLTDQVPGARDLELDQFGNVWVSQTSQGTVSLVYLKDRQTPEVSVVLRNLRKPHGLAFDPEHPTALYIAEETRISRLPTYSDGPMEKIADLPAGGRHFTRSLLFGRDGRLYVSVGSTCDVCREENPEHGTILSMKPDGSDRQVAARGLRNAVFMSNRGDTTIWATEMGRDNLGDNLPPDEVNVISGGSTSTDYGWPICYGARVHDTVFDKNQYIRDPCADTEAPAIQIPAHSAPLGLAFLPNGDLLVAYHGSWNRTIPTGYKVVRFGEDPEGPGGTWKEYDFLTGFLKGGAAIGRPVDVLPMPDGSVLVSDDKRGAIWKVRPN